MGEVTPLFKAPAKAKPVRDKDVYQRNREARRRMAESRCEAEGLHHPDCPGEGWNDMGLGAFVTHHVLPRSHGGSDQVENLRYLWNGLTPFGAGGCHGRIHSEPKLAKALGLLK